ncbi:MAG: hypothetical protein JNL08_16790 [Planctomycetes bacterium]|nr:hypothetical protein [Planctomycetota bacterium]
MPPLPPCLPPLPPRPRTAAIGFWIRRYAVQDLTAKLAALATAALLAATERTAGSIATASAAAEILAFYAVAFWRAPAAATHGVRLARLLREYGPAELVDLAVRPIAMVAPLPWLPPVAAVAVGSLLADVLFYATAVAAARRFGLALH